jgi:hypothetical protein
VIYIAAARSLWAGAGFRLPVESELFFTHYSLPAALFFLVGRHRSCRGDPLDAAVLKDRLLVSTCLSLLLGAQLQVSVNWLQFNYQNGIGYAGRTWRESQTLNRLKR